MEGTDGVVVGSALVRLLHEEFGESSSGSWEKVVKFINALKEATKRRTGA
jgi:tryptophan synthase alpha subunit